MLPLAYPEPTAAEACALHFDSTQEMQAALPKAIVMSFVAQGKVDGEPPLLVPPVPPVPPVLPPLLELQAAEKTATEAATRAPSLRISIMKEPPDVADQRWTALPQNRGRRGARQPVTFDAPRAMRIVTVIARMRARGHSVVLTVPPSAEQAWLTSDIVKFGP
jgi:hypothetical protein